MLSKMCYDETSQAYKVPTKMRKRFPGAALTDLTDPRGRLRIFPWGCYFSDKYPPLQSYGEGSAHSTLFLLEASATANSLVHDTHIHTGSRALWDFAERQHGWGIPHWPWICSSSGGAGKETHCIVSAGYPTLQGTWAVLSKLSLLVSYSPPWVVARCVSAGKLEQTEQRQTRTRQAWLVLDFDGQLEGRGEILTYLLESASLPYIL